MSLSNFTDTVAEIQLAGIVARNGLKNIIHKFSRASVNTTLETIWNGPGNYPFPSVGSVLSLVSDNVANDIGGVGGRTILIVGLDENFLAIEEIVIMTGLTPVLTIKQFSRVTNMTIQKVGSGGVVVGIITATHVTDGTVIAIIDNTRGRTMQAVYTVPANKIGLLIQADATTGKGKSVSVEFYIRDWMPADLEYTGFSIRHIADTFEGVYSVNLKVPLPLGPRSDIDLRGVADVASTNATVSFDIFLIDAN